MVVRSFWMWAFSSCWPSDSFNYHCTNYIYRSILQMDSILNTISMIDRASFGQAMKTAPHNPDNADIFKSLIYNILEHLGLMTWFLWWFMDYSTWREKLSKNKFFPYGNEKFWTPMESRGQDHQFRLSVLTRNKNDFGFTMALYGRLFSSSSAHFSFVSAEFYSLFHSCLRAGVTVILVSSSWQLCARPHSFHARFGRLNRKKKLRLHTLPWEFSSLGEKKKFALLVYTEIFLIN